jgi:hypothetical protein
MGITGERMRQDHYPSRTTPIYPGNHDAGVLLGGGIPPCASGLESNALMRSLISLWS